jgi:CP family cyanate transporter-like MFS transporter
VAEARTQHGAGLSAGVAGAALVIVALAFRPQLAAIGPLVPSIRDDLGVTHAMAGLLTTIPVLCMGLFAPIGPRIAHRLGIRGGVLASVALIALFGVLRALAPGAEAILLLTFGVGLGIGTAGPLMTMFVRSRLPGLLVHGTAAYSTGIVMGAAIAAAVAVPLADAFGGWRWSLAILSLAALGSLGAWAVLTRPRLPRRPGRMVPVAEDAADDAARGAAGGPAVGAAGGAAEGTAPRRRHVGLPWRDGLAWALGLAFGMQSWLYYGTVAWLVSVYVERGWSQSDAGLLLSAFNVAILGATVAAPFLIGRLPTRRAQLAVSAGASTTGLLGVALGLEPAVLWAIVAGIGLGTYFTLINTVPADTSPLPAEVGATAAFMLLIGYSLAAAAPFVLGWVRDGTGEFAASLWILVAVALLLIPVSWSLSPGRLAGHRRVHEDATPAAPSPGG